MCLYKITAPRETKSAVCKPVFQENLREDVAESGLENLASSRQIDHDPFMSAIATFVLLPKSNIDGLRKAATPTKRLFGAPEDMLHDYLDEHGHPAAEFYGSGYVLGTVLTFLKEQRGLDLMHSEYDELGEYLSKERQATYFVFTEEHKRLYSEQLSAEIFSQSELCEYFNKFNEVAEIEIGEAMLDGIRALQESLEQLDADSVIIFGIV